MTTTSSNLRSLRTSRKKLRDDFEKAKKEEWAQLVAETDARIQLEVNRLYQNGMKVAAIMREYGTSDRKTVTDLLFTQSNEGFVSALATALTWTHVQGDTWTVTDGANTAEFVVLKDEESLVLLGTSDQSFGEAVTFDHFRPFMEN